MARTSTAPVASCRPPAAHGDIHSLPLDFAHELTCNTGFSILCDGVPEVLKAVRTNLRANAKLIKICASGGVMSEIDHPMHQQFSDEELAAIVGEAARAERIVAAHCHGKAGIMAALRAGVHSVEHGSFLDEEAADLMVEQGTWLVPTRYVNEALLQQAENLPRYVYEKGQMVSGVHEQAMKIAVAKGVKIAAGCDIFVSGQMYGTGSSRGDAPDQRRDDRPGGDRGGHGERPGDTRPAGAAHRPTARGIRRRRDHDGYQPVGRPQRVGRCRPA